MGKVGNTELYKFLQNISLEDYIPITRKSDQKLFNVPLGALLGVNQDGGTVFSQNNKIPSFYTNGSRSGYSSISEAFNNSSQILVTEEEILNVVNTYQIVIGTSISLVTKRYLLKVGKGTYGSGSENNLVDNDFLLYATEEPTVIIPVSSNNQPIVETIIVPDNSVDVFTIVNQSDQLFEIIDGTDTFFVIVNQDSTDSSTNKTYRFIGSEGNYGSGSSNSLPNDFIEISNNTNVPQSTENNRLVSGVVSHLSGLQFQSTQASYYINNVLYNVNPQIVEINEGDQNNDRFDVFVLDETGTLNVVEGTPNTNPAKPEIDPITQVEIGFVLVTANATVSNPPNSISIESVYDENLGEPNEWTVLASTLDTNIDSTEEPFSGSKHIKFDTSGSGVSIFFFNDTPIKVEDFNTLDFMLFLKQIKLSAITIQFTLGGQPVSDYRFVNNGQFNYDELDTDAYQSIVIPSSAFSFTSSSFDGIIFRFGNGVQSFQNSWLLDRIRLSLGVSNTTINQDNKSFISSPDTPETYKDQAGKFARVKSDEKGLEFDDVEIPEYEIQFVAPNFVLLENGVPKTTIDLSVTITETIQATETSLTAFVAENGNYTFQQGDVISIISAPDSIIELYIYKGTDKTVEGNYQKIDVSKIDWANILNKPTNLTSLEVRDSNGIAQFTISDFIEIVGGDYDLANKRFTVGALSPFSVFLDVTNGNDLTGEIRNFKKPFKTFTAMINALPTYEGETFDIHLIGGNITVGTQLSSRNFRFISYGLSTLDFTDIRDVNGNEVDRVFANVNRISTWTFEGGNISINCDAGRKINPDLSANRAQIIWKGHIDKFTWATDTNQTTFRTVGQTDILFNEFNVAVGSGSTIGSYDVGGQPYGINEAKITILNMNTYAPISVKTDFKGTLDIKKITNLSGGDLTHSMYTIPDCRIFIGELVNVSGRFLIGAKFTHFNDSFMTGGQFELFSGVTYSGNMFAPTYSRSNNISSLTTFKNFKGNLRRLYIRSSGVLQLENSEINCIEGLVYRMDDSTVEDCVILKGHNTIIEDTGATGEIFKGQDAFDPLLVSNINILKEGTLKVNTNNLGSDVTLQDITPNTY